MWKGRILCFMTLMLCVSEGGFGSSSYHEAVVSIDRPTGSGPPISRCEPERTENNGVPHCPHRRWSRPSPHPWWKKLSGWESQWAENPHNQGFEPNPSSVLGIENAHHTELLVRIRTRRSQALPRDIGEVGISRLHVSNIKILTDSLILELYDNKKLFFTCHVQITNTNLRGISGYLIGTTGWGRCRLYTSWKILRLSSSSVASRSTPSCVATCVPVQRLNISAWKEVSWKSSALITCLVLIQVSRATSGDDCSLWTSLGQVDMRSSCMNKFWMTPNVQ